MKQIASKVPSLLTQLFLKGNIIPHNCFEMTYKLMAIKERHHVREQLILKHCPKEGVGVSKYEFKAQRFSLYGNI